MLMLCKVNVPLLTVNVWLRFVFPPVRPVKLSPTVALAVGLSTVLTTGDPGQLVAPGETFCFTMTPPRQGETRHTSHTAQATPRRFIGLSLCSAVWPSELRRQCWYP